jgi:transcriptional regulator with XRE-family HTH domain
MSDNEGEARVIRTVPADSFGHRLMLARAERGHLTVKEAAEKCGLNYGSWSNWEHGKLPRDILDVIEAVAEGLNLDRDWLRDGGPLHRQERVRRVRQPYNPGPVRPQSRRPRRLDRLTMRQPA